MFFYFFFPSMLICSGEIACSSSFKTIGIFAYIDFPLSYLIFYVMHRHELAILLLFFLGTIYWFVLTLFIYRLIPTVVKKLRNMYSHFHDTN